MGMIQPLFMQCCFCYSFVWRLWPLRGLSRAAVFLLGGGGVGTEYFVRLGDFSVLFNCDNSCLRYVNYIFSLSLPRDAK